VRTSYGVGDVCPEFGEERLPALVLQIEAVRLFVERAQAASPDFRSNDSVKRSPSYRITS
jgi:hypothetical protein